MNTSLKPSRRPHVRIESLERRQLLSGNWTNADSLPFSPSGSDFVDAIATDGGGNVYAVGSYNGKGLIREKAAGSSSFVTVPATGGPNTAIWECKSVAVDHAGNVFASARASRYDSSGNPTYLGTIVLEQPVGAAGFTPVNISVPTGAFWDINGYKAFAADASGDVFAVGNVRIPTGTVTTGHGPTAKTYTTYAIYGTLFEMAAGQSSFSPVHEALGSDPEGITLIDTGPSAGIYVMDYGSSFGGRWNITKSTDRGITWKTVDVFDYNPKVISDAQALASDASGNGNVYVVGIGWQSVQTGTTYTYTKVKGQIVVTATPIYTNYEHWLTRQSSDGGATWKTVDDFQHSQSADTMAYDVADMNGAVYVTGGVDSGNDFGGIVRTNASGTWQTSDDYTNDPTTSDIYTCVGIDPTTSTVYAGTGDSWVIRSESTAADVGAMTTASFSSTPISRPVDDIFG